MTATVPPGSRPGHAPGSAVGLGFGLVAAAAFGTSGALGASLLAAGWSPGAAVALRITLAALILTAPAALQLRSRWVRASPRSSAWPRCSSPSPSRGCSLGSD